MLIKNFFKLGNLNSIKAISILFYAGLIPLIVQSYIIGKYIYLTNTYMSSVNTIRDGQTWLTGQEVNNAPLGLLGGVVSFVVQLVIWKMVCELLIIFFRYFEMNTKRDL